MRLGALIYFYRQRLREHAGQEALAAAGIAVAVALVLAGTVASQSITGAASQVVHTVIGPADLQLEARGPNGFGEGLLAYVKRLPGVRQAAPLLEQTATVQAAGGRRATVEVAGTDLGLAVLDGLSGTLPATVLAPGGIAISKATARTLNLPSSHQTVRLLLRGTATSMSVSAVLGKETGKGIAQAQVAVMPLARLQRISGLTGRVSRILIESRTGQRRSVEGELRALTAGRVTVAPADQDISLLAQALGPSTQASALFAGLAALLGFLFAFNAMLLTVPARRRAIADLRVQGTSRAAIVQMMIFEALCLGVAASLVGLLAGYALAIGVFQQSPGYLSRAFTLGSGTVIGLAPVLLALFGGVASTCLASMVPLLDLRAGKPKDAALTEREGAGARISNRTRSLLAICAAGLLLAASGLFVFVPSVALLACAALALATVLAVPIVLALAVSAAEAISKRYQQLTVLPLAVFSLRATTWRALALSATGAVALFGSVALGASRSDLLRGIDSYTAHYARSASIWAINPGDNQAVNDFPAARTIARINQVEGVAAVTSFQGSFLNFDGRRVWVIAWPASTGFTLLRGQIVHGRQPAASKALAEGGAITVSDQIAKAHDVKVGGLLTLPTPSGVIRYRVVATTTNFGWSPGAILMSTAEYRRAWATANASALGIDLQPGARTAVVRSAIERRLGARSGLEVLSAGAREAQIESSASEGLGQLGYIADLLVAAAILAMVAALWSSIRQRRKDIAAMRLQGGSPSQARRVMLVESALMLGSGGLTGALAGVYGQVVIDGYLIHVTGFPVSAASTGLRPLEIFALVIAAVLTIVSLPGWLTSRTPATLALND